MINYIHFSVGILGNAASLLLYGAPIVTFRRVIKKGSTEDFSGFPYAVALLNCLLYTWYGSPLISNRSENFLVSTVNGVGIILQLLFVSIYLKFAPRQSKIAMVRIVAGVITVFAAIATVSQLALHDHKSRKMLVGTSGMIVTVVMYASPLSIVKLVIRTKSVEFMPFHFSLFAFINSCLWMTYFLFDKDLILAVTSIYSSFFLHIFLYFSRNSNLICLDIHTVLWSMQCPNILGVPLGIGQISLYCMYRKHLGLEDNRVLDRPDPEIGLKENANAEKTNSNSLTEHGNMNCGQ